MKKQKSIFFLGILAVIIIVVAFVVVLKENNNPVLTRLADVKIAGAEAQTYSPSNAPTVAPSDLIFGSTAAPLKIFVYEDYSSPYSAALADTLEKISQSAGTKLAIIARPFILKNSPLSAPTAAFVSCANDSGKGREARALIFAQVKNSLLSADKFSAYGTQLGLKANDLAACLTNSQKSEKMNGSQLAAASYGVIGAPTLFVGDSLIVGARPYGDYIDSNGDKIEGLKTVVDEKLAAIK